MTGDSDVAVSAATRWSWTVRLPNRSPRPWTARTPTSRRGLRVHPARRRGLEWGASIGLRDRAAGTPAFRHPDREGRDRFVRGTRGVRVGHRGQGDPLQPDARPAGPRPGRPRLPGDGRRARQTGQDRPAVPDRGHAGRGDRPSPDGGVDDGLWLIEECNNPIPPPTRVDYVSPEGVWTDSSGTTGIGGAAPRGSNHASGTRRAAGRRRSGRASRCGPDWFGGGSSLSDCVPPPVVRTSTLLRVQLVELTDQHGRFTCLAPEDRVGVTTPHGP